MLEKSKLFLLLSKAFTREKRYTTNKLIQVVLTIEEEKQKYPRLQRCSCRPCRI
jgi:hypothetical protein